MGPDHPVFKCAKVLEQTKRLVYTVSKCPTVRKYTHHALLIQHTPLKYIHNALETRQGVCVAFAKHGVNILL